MSEYLKPAIITANVSLEHGATMLANTAERLIEEYDFDFRGYGSVLRLEYDGEEYRDAAIIRHSPPIEEIDRAYVTNLVAEHGTVAITGDFRWPGLHRLLPIKVGLCRTFTPEKPVCLVVHMDAWIYNSLENADERIDHEAADRFQKLAITFGAHELTDGFVTTNIASLDEVCTFDGEALKQSYVNQPSIQERWEQRGRKIHVPHGQVNGIRNSLIGFEEARALAQDADVFETVTGMVIISTVHIDVDVDLDDDA